MSDSEHKVEDLLKDINKFNVQCFLREHMDLLNGLKSSISDVTPYKNFVILDGNPTEAIHQLVTKKGMEPIFNITPAQLALLMPKIQIFKIIYNEGKKKIGEKELFFKDHTSPKMIENMLRSISERGDDVGIKDFSFSLAGKNPAESGTTKCKLSLYFQNIASLLVEGANKVSFKDLILYGKNKEEQNNTTNYQIKVVVGWAIPDVYDDTLIDKKIRSAIENSKIVMLLQMTDYTLNFNENGSVELTIDFFGAMEGIMYNEKSDLLLLTASGKKEKELRDAKTKEEAEKQKGKGPEDIKKKIDKISVTDIVLKGPSSAFEEKRSQTEIERDSAINTYDQLDKQEKYSRLLNLLYTKSNIFYFDVKLEYVEGLNKQRMDALEVLSKEKNLKGSEIKAAAAATLYQQRKKFSGNLKIFRIVDKRNDAGASEANQVIQKMFSGEKETVKDQYGKSIPSFKPLDKEKQDEIFKNYTDSQGLKTNADGTKRVNFLFFGDLLDAVLNVLFTENRTDILNLKVILGSFLYYDPLSFLQGHPKAKIVNLADVPIALDLFITWYMTKVVKEQKESYKLGLFLRDVIGDLLIPSLEENCYFNLGTIKEGTNVGIQFFTDSINPIFINGKRLRLEDLKSGTVNKQTFQDGSHKDINDISHYIYIYSTFSPIPRGESSYEKNIEKGIYHLFVGGERGLVKSIKFDKQQQPFVPEMRATADSEEVKRITGLYTASIKMVGNTLFRLGQIFYVDTAKMSSILDNPTKQGSISSDLGIGGYYSVIKVNYDLFKGGFETEIEGWRQKDDTGIKPDTPKVIAERAAAFNNASNLMTKMEVEVVNQQQKQTKSFGRKVIDWWYKE